MWTGWPLARVLDLFLGIAFLAVFVQVTLFHMRQNFWHPSQWLPVLATPVAGVTALLLAWENLALLRTIFLALCLAGGLIGLIGTYYHVAGTGKRVGGYSLNNFMVGPPPMLPVMVIALSALGLAALYWV